MRTPITPRFPVIEMKIRTEYKVTIVAIAVDRQSCRYFQIKKETLPTFKMKYLELDEEPTARKALKNKTLKLDL